MVFHHTALYELLYLLVLFVLLTWLLHVRKERPSPGTAMGISCLWYGVRRFASDALRANAVRVLGMTGAQYLCIALVPPSAWVLLQLCKSRPSAVSGTSVSEWVSI